jgi:hypothetical protein
MILLVLSLVQAKMGAKKRWRLREEAAVNA